MEEAEGLDIKRDENGEFTHRKFIAFMKNCNILDLLLLKFLLYMLHVNV